MKVRIVAAAAFALSDCLDPTEIEVVISTDVACSSVNSTAIAVGAVGDDVRDISGKTPSCASDGGIGTIVVTPSHGVGDAVGIRVMLGVGMTAGDGCKAPAFAGCIVARRSLRYIPHTPLVLPIELEQACLNNACDPNSTCVGGICVDAGIPTCDENGTCLLDAGSPPPTDGGPCDLPPVLVASSPTPVTPHLVMTRTGYAVGFDSAAVDVSNRTYAVVAISHDGKPGPTVTLSTGALTQGAAIGPLGTDGTNFAGTFLTGAAAMLGEREIDPLGGPLAASSKIGTFQLGRAGMHYEANGSFYALFLIENGGPTFEVWPTNNAPPLSVGRSIANASDPALMWFNGKYYGAVHDASSCIMAIEQLTATTATTAGSLSWPSCTTVRMAENAPGVVLFVTRQTTNDAGAYTLTARNSSPVTSSTIDVDAVDDQAIVVLPGTGSAFHIVYGLGGSVRDAPIDSATLVFTPPSIVANATGFQGSGIGFDAVGEPGTLTHDIAFWAATPAPGIYFTRICQ